MSADKPRIAYLSPLVRGRGGWPTATLGIVRAMSDYVEPVLIVTPSDAAAARDLFPGVEVHTLPVLQPMVSGSWRVLWHMLPTLAAVGNLPKLRVDLVHSLEMFPTGWAGDRLARKEAAPHVLTAFGTYGVIWSRWPASAYFYGGVLRRAAWICPMSHGTADRIRLRFPQETERAPFEVVLQGSEFAARVPAAWAAEKKFPAAPIVLSVGGIKPRKGYAECLSAFALLQKRFPDAEYRIAGGGVGNAYHRELEAQIEREQIRNVRFLGALTWEELDPHYREASMLVMASQEEDDNFEGFVLVFLEAGAYGLPVIGSRTGGIPDAVLDDETGFLAESGAIGEIARRMAQLAGDPALSARLGRAGRKRAEELTWQRFAAQQFDVYRRVWGVRG